MRIGRIEAVEKRYALFPVAQKRQAHMPQLVFPGLGMSVTAELRFCLRFSIRDDDMWKEYR